jgi:hypothetical protein
MCPTLLFHSVKRQMILCVKGKALALNGYNVFVCIVLVFISLLFSLLSFSLFYIFL